ncbi:DsbA family protein [Fictibacillus phosphorivorans]|uniref:Thiol-disulfide oxidoreductase n=1 Tax=Fictibacillus phosphorivorans TaxID=1221500 RepID=A0A160ILX7_9BACL|nr:thioredoxin domain-containing protein [Fictibacillus phosphorivorans]ANC77104.1 thiol-disulfide oxidoreductase [Fictibacillus phosphorivorans]MQR96266.1 thiol-disulfide oxidoreductase [Fictibacillus phosphorivorans]
MVKQKKNKAYVNSSKKKNNSSPVWLFWTIGILTLGLIIFLFSGALDNDTSTADISYEKQPYLGEKDATVNIIEFGDYKCPVCKSFNESFFPLIDKELIQTGKVKFYFLNYPFINVDSKRSAIFGESVYNELGNETFWKFHKLLYEKQPEDQSLEKQDIFTEKFLSETLGEVTSEENVKKVTADWESKANENAVKTDEGLVSDLGVTGTPTLFVNGKKFEGTSIEDLVKMVDDAAKESK